MNNRPLPSGVTLNEESVSFRTPDGRRVLNVHQYRTSEGRWWDAGGPSPYLERVTPEQLRQQAQAWLEAADWLEQRQLPD